MAPRKPRVGAKATTGLAQTATPTYTPDPTSVELRGLLNAAKKDHLTSSGIAADALFSLRLLEIIARGLVGLCETIEARGE